MLLSFQQQLPVSLRVTKVRGYYCLYAYICAILFHHSQDLKKGRKTKMEKAMESTMAVFIKHQEETAKDFKRREKERLREELET